MRALPAVACALLVSLLGACVQPPTAPSGLMDVAERPAEKALLAGIRAYEDAQYAEAEKQLNAAESSRPLSRLSRRSWITRTIPGFGFDS